MKIEEAVRVSREHKEKHYITLEETIIEHEAMKVLADAYLALHREDDGELVTLTRCLTAGASEFNPIRRGVYWKLPPTDTARSKMLYVTNEDGKWLRWYIDKTEFVGPRTMGQLRHLVRGLGGEA